MTVGGALADAAQRRARVRCAARILATMLWLSLTACDSNLPDPESPGAHLYATRCGGCHRLYAPTSMKPDMWRVQVERMQGEMVRRGVPPLTPAERDTLLAYLQRHGS